MQTNFSNLIRNKILIIALCFIFALVATNVFAALTLNDTTITSDGTLTLTAATNTLLNGNVGIGTTAPTAMLEIVNNQNNITNAIVTNLTDAAAAVTRVTLNTTNGSLVAFAASPSYTGITEFANKAGIYTSVTATPIGNIVIASRTPLGGIDFYTGGSAAVNRRAVIDSSGNFGVGLVLPLAKFHVANGHFASSQTIPPTPTVTGTGFGSPSLVAGSTDTKGGITATVGAAAGTLVVTFQTAYASAPICTVSPATPTAQVDSGKVFVTSATGALTINFVATPTGGTETWNYICLQ